MRNGFTGLVTDLRRDPAVATRDAAQVIEVPVRSSAELTAVAQPKAGPDDFDDPYWFREDMQRAHKPNTLVERSLMEASNIVQDVAEDNPSIVVTLPSRRRCPR